VRDGRDVALTKIKERWPSLTNTASLDRWFRVWENNVEIAASYRSNVNLSNFDEVRYEDVCHLADSAVTSLARLTNSDPDAVRQAIRQLARTDRLAKWTQHPNNFTFASSSKMLRAYGYPSA
jgi:class 3 adenylate cyclase